MSFPPNPHDFYAYMVENHRKARESAENALATVAEYEMRKLAERFPRRRIEMHSGMGVTQICIAKRNPTDSLDQYVWTNRGDDQWQWPESVGEPAPDFWSAIRIYEDEVSDKGADPGLGTIIYQDGKRIEGLPAGGAVR